MTAEQPAGLSIRIDLHPMTAAALALIALQTVIRGAVSSASYFWQDDFGHLELARRVGLGGDFLVRDYNDHLEILPNFLYWFLTLGGGQSFVPAALLLVALQLVASLLMWRVLDQLFGPRGLTLVALTLYLFTPLTLVAATWLAAGLEALTLQISLLGCLWAWLRMERSGQSRWGGLALVFLAVGLASWEKAAVVLPAVLALHWVVVWSGLPLRERWRRFWARKLWWGAHAALLAGYVVLYARVTDGSERSVSTSAKYADSAAATFFDVFVPGVLGGPWRTSGAENTLYPSSPTLLILLCVAVITGVVAASFAVSGFRALAPWLVVGIYLAGDIALMLWGRAAYLELVSRDPRYLIDAIPVVAICVAAAFAPGAERRARVGGEDRALPTMTPEAARTVAITTSAVFLTSALVTTFLLAPVLQRTYAKNYVHGTIRLLQDNAGLSVVNVDPPQAVTRSVDQRGMLAAVGYTASFGQPGRELYLIDSLGLLREAEVIDPTLDRQGPEPDCGWGVGHDRVDLGFLPSSTLKSYVLRVGYVTGVPARLHVKVDGVRQTVDVEPGLGYVYFVVEALSGGIEAWTRKAEARICLSDVLAGKPWPRD